MILLKLGFNDDKLCKDGIEIADETNFVVSLDTGKIFGFMRNQHVMYADVVSGGVPMTMMVRNSGGVNAIIHHPMIAFQDMKIFYHILCVPDSVQRVRYRSSPRRWMNESYGTSSRVNHS